MKKILLPILLLTGSWFLSAQWTTDTEVNTLVVSSESDDAESITTSTGETYIVYWKVVPVVNYEVRMQVLDADGYQLLGSDGMLISDTLPMSTYTMIWSLSLDSNDNLFIGLTCSADATGRVFKMNTNGDFLWGSGGVVINETAYMTTVCPLSDGGAYVSWNTGGAAKMQKYDVNGSAIWPNAKPVGNGNTSPGNMFELSDGSLLMIYHQVNTGIYSTLYAQRYDTSGNPMWASVQLANGSTVFNTYYSALQINDDVYIGYKSSAGNRFDAYLQYIDPNGNLPWGINGSDFDTNQTNYEQDTHINSNSLGQIWSICNYTDTSQGQGGVYVQKFDATTGNRLLGDQAHQVYAISPDYYAHRGQLQIVNDNPIFMLELSNKLQAVLLDEYGNFAWTPNEKDLGTFNASKGRWHFNKNVNDQVVATFTENRGSGTHIYAQNLPDLTLGINEVEENLHLLINNPFTNQLKMSAAIPFRTVSIFDTKGIEVLHKELFQDDSRLILNTDSLQPGVYFLKLDFVDGKRVRRKLIKR